jgi:hypothetical protein
MKDVRKFKPEHGTSIELPPGIGLSPMIGSMFLVKPIETRVIYPVLLNKLELILDAGADAYEVDASWRRGLLRQIQEKLPNPMVGRDGPKL